jgi:hypothetical protein
MSDWAAREKVLLQENDLAFAHALQEHEWADATTWTHRWRSKLNAPNHSLASALRHLSLGTTGRGATVQVRKARRRPARQAQDRRAVSREFVDIFLFPLTEYQLAPLNGHVNRNS